MAIKQLDRNGLQGHREFLVEVLMLSLLHHQNLVNLIGYCANGDQRLLVYEFMPSGTLENHLLGMLISCSHYLKTIYSKLTTNREQRHKNFAFPEAQTCNLARALIPC